jgi:hypothetical protein
MVKPNRTKPEGYMRPLDAPGGYPHALHCSKTPWPGFKSRQGSLALICLKVSLYIRVEA